MLVYIDRVRCTLANAKKKKWMPYGHQQHLIFMIEGKKRDKKLVPWDSLGVHGAPIFQTVNSISLIIYIKVGAFEKKINSYLRNDLWGGPLS